MQSGKIILLATILSVVLFFENCKKDELSPVEYAAWVENESNGLKVKKNISDYEFTLLYKPLDYVVVREMKSEELKKKLLDERKKELEGMQYYTLKIKSNTSNDLMKTGISSEDEYYQRLEYFMSPAQDDISLIDGRDTLPCLLYHFERNYGLAPFNNIVLGFAKTEDKKEQKDKTLIYDDQVLGTGKIQITIKGNDIEQLPLLKTY